MAAPPIQNVFQLKKVAEVSSKPCWICFKPTTSVLITTCQKDFFYICPTHLTDKGFATPIINEAEEAEKRQQEELEIVKKEYEEKMKKKEERKKAKMKEKAEGKDKDKDKEEEKNAKEKEKEKKREEAEDEDDKKKLEAKEKEVAGKAKVGEGRSKEYQLHRDFYNIRIQRIRDKIMAKRNAERLRDPSTFPSVPKGGLV